MKELETLGALGITLPTPTYLVGVILFSIIGYAAYRYGKKSSASFTMWIGVTLMLYPYVVSETWMMYVIGAGLCVGLYVLRGK
jgi:hypothetical protein